MEAADENIMNDAFIERATNATNETNHQQPGEADLSAPVPKVEDSFLAKLQKALLAEKTHRQVQGRHFRPPIIPSVTKAANKNDTILSTEAHDHILTLLADFTLVHDTALIGYKADAGAEVMAMSQVRVHFEFELKETARRLGVTHMGMQDAKDEQKQLQQHLNMTRPKYADLQSKKQRVRSNTEHKTEYCALHKQMYDHQAEGRAGMLDTIKQLRIAIKEKVKDIQIMVGNSKDAVAKARAQFPVDFPKAGGNTTAEEFNTEMSQLSELLVEGRMADVRGIEDVPADVVEAVVSPALRSPRSPPVGVNASELVLAGVKNSDLNELAILGFSPPNSTDSQLKLAEEMKHLEASYPKKVPQKKQLSTAYAMQANTATVIAKIDSMTQNIKLAEKKQELAEELLAGVSEEK